MDKSVVMTLKKNIDPELQILAQERIVAPVIGGTTAGVLKIIDEDGNIINESELVFLKTLKNWVFSILVCPYLGLDKISVYLSQTNLKTTSLKESHGLPFKKPLNFLSDSSSKKEHSIFC